MLWNLSLFLHRRPRGPKPQSWSATRFVPLTAPPSVRNPFATRPIFAQRGPCQQSWLKSGSFAGNTRPYFSQNVHVLRVGKVRTSPDSIQLCLQDPVHYSPTFSTIKGNRTQGSTGFCSASPFPAHHKLSMDSDHPTLSKDSDFFGKVPQMTLLGWGMALLLFVAVIGLIVWGFGMAKKLRRSKEHEWLANREGRSRKQDASNRGGSVHSDHESGHRVGMAYELDSRSHGQETKGRHSGNESHAEPAESTKKNPAPPARNDPAPASPEFPVRVTSDGRKRVDDWDSPVAPYGGTAASGRSSVSSPLSDDLSMSTDGAPNTLERDFGSSSDQAPSKLDSLDRASSIGGFARSEVAMAGAGAGSSTSDRGGRPSKGTAGGGERDKMAGGNPTRAGGRERESGVTPMDRDLQSLSWGKQRGTAGRNEGSASMNVPETQRRV